MWSGTGTTEPGWWGTLQWAVRAENTIAKRSFPQGWFWGWCSRKLREWFKREKKKKSRRWGNRQVNYLTCCWHRGTAPPWCKQLQSRAESDAGDPYLEVSGMSQPLIPLFTGADLSAEASLSHMSWPLPSLPSLGDAGDFFPSYVHKPPSAFLHPLSVWMPRLGAV